MKKHITFLLLFTFLFTACAERGYTPKPVIKQVTQTTLPAKQTITKSSSKIQNLKPTVIKKKETPKVEKKVINTTIIPTPVVVQEVNETVTEEYNIFSLSHEEKKTISGVFIFIIGLIILL